MHASLELEHKPIMQADLTHLHVWDRHGCEQQDLWPCHALHMQVNLVGTALPVSGVGSSPCVMQAGLLRLPGGGYTARKGYGSCPALLRQPP